ncbi:MAG: hypothetical protein R3F49_09975 [Planctomycetota bacterium]
MRADRITRAAVLVVAVGFVWRNHVGQPGLATHDVFPASLGVSSAGGFEVQRWSSRDGAASASVVFDRSGSRCSERQGAGPAALRTGAGETIDERWPGVSGEAIGHLWFARNGLLHCPPGTWTGPMSFVRDEADLVLLRGEQRVLVPTGEWSPVTMRATGRHRIEVEAYRASQEILSDDHARRFEAVGRDVAWINVTAQRSGERMEVVLRWFARHPERELLTQRLAFLGEPRVPVAIEADWADPATGEHALHELFVLRVIEHDAAQPAEAPRVLADAAALRTAQAAALQGHADPWSDDPRPPGAPVIGPLRPGFADPKEAFLPWTPPLRLRGGTPR